MIEFVALLIAVSLVVLLESLKVYRGDDEAAQAGVSSIPRGNRLRPGPNRGRVFLLEDSEDPHVRDGIYFFTGTDWVPF